VVELRVAAAPRAGWADHFQAAALLSAGKSLDGVTRRPLFSRSLIACERTATSRAPTP